MSFLKKFWFLGVIAILALGIRVWDLPQNPPGLTWDETALGYNAYSLLKTARDEYGVFLPVNLKSFGDYKPAIYTYLDIPFVAIFGLGEMAVRLPNVFLGVGAVVLIYFLVHELLKDRRLGLLAALMLAISPLAIQFSRPAFESSAALFFNLLGTLFFLKGLKSPRFFIFAALAFGLSLFTYQSSRLFLPVFILSLLIIYWRKIKINRDSIVGIVILGSFGILLLYSIFGLGQAKRLSAMNLFAYSRSSEIMTQISSEDGLAPQSWVFQVLHGNWFDHTRALFERYLIYFSPKTLFMSGDYSPRHGVPDLGVLSYFSILLIPLGFIFLWQKRPSSNLIFLWLILAPIPAVLSRDLITMVRAFNLVVPFSILEGAGLVFLGNKIWQFNKRAFYLFILLAAVFISGNFIIFADRYFIHAPKEYSQGWLYGYKQILTSPNMKDLSSYNKVVITDDLGQPYIYYLFYRHYLPEKFQQQAVLDQPTVDVGTVRKLDNIEFRHIYWPSDRSLKNSLFIGTLEELPDKDVLPYAEYKILDEVNFLDGEPALRIVATQPEK